MLNMKNKLNFFSAYDRTDSDSITKNIIGHMERDFRRRGIDFPFSNNDPCSILSHKIDYSSASFEESLFIRQCQALYSKASDYYEEGVNPTKVAFDKFIECEKSCSIINDKLLAYIDCKDTLQFESILLSAQRKIQHILGDCPDFGALFPAFGSGSNTTINVKFKNETDKFQSVLVSGRSSTEALAAFFDTFPALRGHNDLVRYGNGKLSFVPKNYKAHRTIIVEPTLNTFVQKAYGSWIRDRLLMSGCDLRDQNINRNRARLGSIHGNLCTIDLSSASDMISLMLVYFLLPTDWFDALFAWRSSHVDYKGSNGNQNLVNYELQKFSSMGNGYTFELESLIFLCICRSVEELNSTVGSTTVFGDDIVTDVVNYHTIESVFHEIGFIINDDKSFNEGPFRESCGGDFYNGYNLRPYYRKDRWSSHGVVSFANHLWRTGFDFYMPSLTPYLISLLPEDHILYGPDGFGDGHIVSNDFVSRPVGKHKGWDISEFQTFERKLNRRRSEIPWRGAVLSLLHSIDHFKGSQYFRSPWKPRISNHLQTISYYATSKKDLAILKGGRGCKKTKIHFFR